MITYRCPPSCTHLKGKDPLLCPKSRRVSFCALHSVEYPSDEQCIVCMDETIREDINKRLKEMTRSMMVYDREVLLGVLTGHQQRTSTGICACGWNSHGKSHSEHVVNIYEVALMNKETHNETKDTPDLAEYRPSDNRDL